MVRFSGATFDAVGLSSMLEAEAPPQPQTLDTEPTPYILLIRKRILPHKCFYITSKNHLCSKITGKNNLCRKPLSPPPCAMRAGWPTRSRPT